MPPKKIKKPKQKPKQKQKQKQVVKQNVKVTVQSSGGSGGGGTPSYLPQQYNDTRQLALLDEIARSIKKAPEVAMPEVAMPVKMPVKMRKEDVPNPVNDSLTLDSVFKAPINFNKPIELGLTDERPITRKKKIPKNPFDLDTNEAGYTRHNSGYESTASAYEPSQNFGFGFPSSAFAKTPYGKIVPKFGDFESALSTEIGASALPMEAIGGGQKEEPVFSGFSIYKK